MGAFRRTSRKTKDRIRPRPNKVRGLKRKPRKKKTAPYVSDAQLRENGAYGVLLERYAERARQKKVQQEQARRQAIMGRIRKHTIRQQIVRPHPPEGMPEQTVRMVKWLHSAEPGPCDECRGAA